MPRRSLAVAAGVVATGALGTALVLAKRRDHRRDVLDLSYLLLPNVRAHATSCIFGSNGTVIVVYSPRSTDSKVEVRVHTERKAHRKDKPSVVQWVNLTRYETRTHTN